MTKFNLLISLRPHFWIFSIIPGCVGLFLSTGTLPLREVIIVTLILSAGPGIAELVNDYIDQYLDKFQKVKKLGVLTLSGGSGVTRVGGVKKEEMLLVTGLLIIIVVGCAILINVYVLLLTLIGLFLAIGYSLGPIRLKSRGPLGPLAMALGRGFVSFHIGWVAFSPLTTMSLLIGWFLSLLMFGTFSLAHLADYPEDKELNIYTFPVLVGFKKAARVAAGTIIMSFLLLGGMVTTSIVTLNVLVLPIVVIGLVLACLMIVMETETSYNISRLQVLGMILFCLAPFIFI